MAAVIKDGGDDPDATHRARIEAFARFDASLPKLELSINGGTGVGRVTLPGLPLPVGEAAINPVPRQQIDRAVREVLAHAGAASSCGVRIVISVPDGERIARHTLNPRLGIIGGISILGTHGTVRAFSHEAWQSAILQSMDVALANRPPQQSALPALCLSTGRRSERLLMACYPALPALCFIQAADHVRFSLEAAAQRALTPLAWGCFFGKLVKLAQGIPYTHARSAPLDMAFIARCHAGLNAAQDMETQLAACNTANQALELLLGAPKGIETVARLVRLAKEQAQAFAGSTVIVHLFHTDGRELAVA
jgi:cobalt-precorrin-5B (C1)-methyltransferase